VRLRHRRPRDGRSFDILDRLGLGAASGTPRTSSRRISIATTRYSWVDYGDRVGNRQQYFKRLGTSWNFLAGMTISLLLAATGFPPESLHSIPTLHERADNHRWQLRNQRRLWPTRSPHESQSASLLELRTEWALDV